jgi:hypothetical protein
MYNKKSKEALKYFVYSFHFLPKLFILKFSKNPIPIPLAPSDPALKVSSQTHMHPALKAMEKKVYTMAPTSPSETFPADRSICNLHQK